MGQGLLDIQCVGGNPLTLSGEAYNLGIAAEIPGEQDKILSVAIYITSKPFHTHWKKEVRKVPKI